MTKQERIETQGHWYSTAVFLARGGGVQSGSDTLDGAKAVLHKDYAYYTTDPVYEGKFPQVIEATIERICDPCNGTGKTQSKRSKFRKVRCPRCRGKESRVRLVTWIDLPRELWA